MHVESVAEHIIYEWIVKLRISEEGLGMNFVKTRPKVGKAKALIALTLT